MDIRNRKILVLGGFGMVGMAIIRKLAKDKPAEVIIASMLESEAKEAVATLHSEFNNVRFTPAWGNVFVRNSLKDFSRNEILDNSVNRAQLVADVLEPLDQEILERSTLYQIISRFRPHIIVDAVNSVTGLAYQDVYASYQVVKNELAQAKDQSRLTDGLVAEVEKLMATLYIPQIIRHIQILHASMMANDTEGYIKIGTSGTGGMGLNIPYTHSEEQPSRMLLSKAALAGAHTLLLFLMGRTPDTPIIKEIKPAAAIAWKGIEYGVIKKRGKPIELFDCTPEAAVKLDNKFDLRPAEHWTSVRKNLESVFIDTGENGIFSLGEFECISAIGQMEFVTPEEIATNTVMEIKGDNTGRDIINALDNAIMGPTYRAGSMRGQALRKMEQLIKQHDVDSVAFELLGPPRLSKLLHEGALIRQIVGSISALAESNADKMTVDLEKLIAGNNRIRSEIISIGIPILMRDGVTLLRGPVVEIPQSVTETSLKMTADDKDIWAKAGWVDLRIANIEKWQERARTIVLQTQSIGESDTSSMFHQGYDYWAIDEDINVGKLAAWIFENEDKGWRVKQ